MTIAINCPSCKSKARAPDNLAGRKVKCPKCGQPIAVPAHTHPGSAAGHIQAESMPQPALQLPSPAPSTSFDTSFSNAEEDEKPSRRRPHSDASTGGGSAHSLGIGSMVLGVVALLFSFIPCIGMFSMPLSGLGLLLGIIGVVVALCRRGHGIGFPIAGSAINGMALVIALFWLGLANVTHKALDENTKEIAESIKKANATNQTVQNDGEKPGTQSANENPMPLKNEDAEWADARKLVRQGDVLVGIYSVTIDQVELKALGEPSRSKEKLLVIRLRIGNAGQTRKVEYESWGDTSHLIDRHVPTLKDNFNNNYRRITFGFGTRVQDQVTSESIHPGKSIDDVLVFEKPVDRIEYLRLELPASAFGGSGNLRFQIPKDMVDQERKRQSEEARRQQADARRREAEARQKADQEAKAGAEREAARKAEEKKKAKEEAERDVARKAELEKKGLPYYPRPLTLESGHNAQEWYQLLRDNPVNARIYKQATTALSALTEEGIPFLLDYLSSQTTPKSRYDALRLIQVQYVHRNDLHKLLPCLEPSKNYQGTRLLALEGLERRAKDLKKDLVPKIESLVEDMLNNRGLSEKTKEEVRSRLKTIRLEANSPAASGQH